MLYNVIVPIPCKYWCYALNFLLSFTLHIKLHSKVFNLLYNLRDKVLHYENNVPKTNKSRAAMHTRGTRVPLVDGRASPREQARGLAYASPRGPALVLSQSVVPPPSSLLCTYNRSS